MKSFREIWLWLKKHPARGGLLGLSISLPIIFLLTPLPARADLDDAIITILSWIFSFFVFILGNLLVKFIDLLVWVAQYNDFIDAEAVKVGWTVVRDMANMFFIVALLLTSFGTVFRFQEYRYNRMLSKLIIMAILINFSKTIAGFFIDVSQVIMLTFVNAFKDLAAGNLTSAFGVDKIVQFSQTASAQGGDINTWSIAGAMFAAVIMLFVATVVVAIFVLYLVQRIIMLWIYVILSPAAYMLSVFPGNLGSFWGTWWRDFTQYVVRGPVIAFFLWLALTIVSLSQAVTSGSILGSTPAESQVGQLGGAPSGQQDLSAFASEATTSANVLNYLVAVGLLVAGLMQAAKAGSAAGGAANRMMGNFQRWGGAMVGAPVAAGLFLPKKITRELGGGMVKRAAYTMADMGLAVGSKIPLLKGYMGKQRGKLRELRHTKDQTALENTDFNSLMAMQGFTPTEAGRANKGGASGLIITKHGKKYAKLSMKDKMKVWKNFAQDKGFKLHYDEQTGNISEEYQSARGRSLFNEAVSKNPALWSVMINDLKQQEGKANPEDFSAAGKAKYDRILKKARQQADKMTNQGINEMSTDFLTEKPGEPDSAQRARYNEDLDVRKAFVEGMARRLSNEKYQDTYDKNVIRDQRLDIMEAYENLQESGDWDYPIELYRSPDLAKESKKEGVIHEGLDAEYQRDIDKKRQQRTAERVAAYKQRGLNFHESGEYLNAPKGFYYDLDNYTLNERQRQRVEARAKAKESGEADYLSGLKTFSTGASNMLAADRELLEKAGVRLSAGGHVTNKQALARLAGLMSEKLATDIKNVEDQITNIDQEEAELRKPTGMIDASGRPLTRADQDPEKIRNIEAQRNALQTQKDIFTQTQKRLQSEKGLSDIQFINKDSYVGNRWNLIAEEATHKKLDQIDPDRSFRNSLMENMSAQELQGIAQYMRKKTGDQSLNTERAFEEYLTKGLVNIRGEKYADKAPDAVKLKEGLALAVKRQAEAKGVKLNLQDLEPEEIEAPAKVGVVTSVAGAVGRKVAEPYQAVKAGKQLEELSRGDRIAQTRKAQVSEAQAQVKSAQEKLTYEKGVLSELQKAAKPEIEKLNSEFERLEQVRKTTIDPDLAAETAKQMNAIRGQILEKQAPINAQKSRVDQSQQALEAQKSQLGEKVEESLRQEKSQEALRGNIPARPAPPTRASVAQPSAAKIQTEAPVPSPEQTAEQVVNITNNIRQEMKNILPSTPEAFRDIIKLGSASLDSALRNSLVMRSLMNNLRNGFNEVAQTKKLSSLAQTEINKRIGNLQKHVDNNDGESFKDEFSSLQRMIGSSSEGAGEGE
ncbi:hypothetical protein C4546_00635 [Candidatus Parcubacteria bacterium]|jgi:hypothetical protein|nr:MAG: hypothetical protein C4546_00635 [Candidatus Parcubacteria bacterium]